MSRGLLIVTPGQAARLGAAVHRIEGIPAGGPSVWRRKRILGEGGQSNDESVTFTNNTNSTCPVGGVVFIAGMEADGTYSGERPARPGCGRILIARDETAYEATGRAWPPGGGLRFILTNGSPTVGMRLGTVLNQWYLAEDRLGPVILAGIDGSDYYGIITGERGDMLICDGNDADVDGPYKHYRFSQRFTLSEDSPGVIGVSAS